MFLAVEGQEPEPDAFGASTAGIVGLDHGDGSLRVPEANPCSDEKEAGGRNRQNP